MAGRDLFYSIFGHLVIGLTLLFLTPVSAGLWGNDRALPPLVFPVDLVQLPPPPRRAADAQAQAIQVPQPVVDDVPELSPLENLEKEELSEKPAADSVIAQKDEDRQEDTNKTFAAADTDTAGRTGDMSHTIIDGTAAGGTDEIFGEYVPAIGYGAADPYFQSLFYAIQRAFRNPVPGYKPVRCVVTFTIMSTGEIKEIKLETSSGIPRYDRAAIRAIERIEWGRPFPKKFKDYEGYHIRMPFEYVPQ